MKTVTSQGEVPSEKKKNKVNGKSFIDRIPGKAWLGISLLFAIIFWTILSILPSTARSFPNIFLVIESVSTMIERGVFTKDFVSSMISILAGFGIGFVLSLPVAILMAWYRPVRFIIEPWIQFIRNIPPLAYVPLIVIS